MTPADSLLMNNGEARAYLATPYAVSQQQAGHCPTARRFLSGT
jgi:hypothetical protein